MEMCDDKHEPIVHEGGECPLCSTVHTLTEAEDTATALTARIKGLTTDIDRHVSGSLTERGYDDGSPDYKMLLMYQPLVSVSVIKGRPLELERILYTADELTNLTD